MLGQVDALNRRVWGDKLTLATLTHALGGLGLGLLLGRADDRRSLASMLLAVSAVAQL
jgi:hypothetical protein